MRAPEFWTRDPKRPGWRARLLAPVAALYALAGRLRMARGRPYRAAAPVICVGNIVAGGAGKTPTVLALCSRLAAQGIRPHILTRGYGGRITGPHRVDALRDKVADVGDEALLMAAHWPVWVGKDRAAAARAAEAAGAEALVMDDGYQNPSLAKDLSILVIDAVYGHGNARVMPAGPLRESLKRGFRRADAVIMIGEPLGDAPWPWTPRGLPVLHARLTPQATGLSLNGRRVVAFAGIGRPAKFFATLREMGARLKEPEAFPDHYRYSGAMLKRLEMRAASENALLVTTEKDAVRFPDWFRGRAVVLPVVLGFDEPDAADALLWRVIERRRAQV